MGVKVAQCEFTRLDCSEFVYLLVGLTSRGTLSELFWLKAVSEITIVAPAAGYFEITSGRSRPDVISAWKPRQVVSTWRYANKFSFWTGGTVFTARKHLHFHAQVAPMQQSCLHNNPLKAIPDCFVLPGARRQLSRWCWRHMLTRCSFCWTVFMLASVQAAAHNCTRQVTIGHWTSNETAKGHLQWTPFSESCKLRNAFDYIRKNNINLFVLGDSVEYWFIRDICERAGEENMSSKFEMTEHSSAKSFPEQAVHGYDSFITCRVENSLVHFAFITGLSDRETFPAFHSQRSPATRLRHAAQNFWRLVKRQPDIIILSCNIWDHYRMPHNASGITDLAALQLWTAELFALVSHVDRTFPSSKTRAFHTTAFTVRDDMPQPVIQDLNMAAVSLFNELPEWSVVDVVALTAPFASRNLYLRDEHHPEAFVQLALLDIYVSLLALKTTGSAPDH